MDCYCVCHSPVSSRAWCEHCAGDNPVYQYHKSIKEQDELLEAHIQNLFIKHENNPYPDAVYSAYLVMELIRKNRNDRKSEEISTVS